MSAVLDILINTDAEKATAELKGLENQSKKTADATAHIDRATKAANDSYRGFGGGVRNASYQLSDFMVQVQGGTSALRAASQQLPQLLAGFGLYGVVAGLFATVFTSIIENFDLFATKTQKASKELDKFGKELSNIVSVGEDVAKFAKDFNATAADGFVEYVKSYNKASASQREEMDLWLKKKLLVEEGQLSDLKKESKGMQYSNIVEYFPDSMAAKAFTPNASRQLDLIILIQKQEDAVKRLRAATEGDTKTATEGSKVLANSVISIQQKIDAIRAESQFIGINNAEKEKAIAISGLEAEAKRSGIGLNRQLVQELKNEIDLKHKALETAEIEKYSMAQKTANEILREQGQVINVNSRENLKYIEQEKLKGFIAQQTIGWNKAEIATFTERANMYLTEKQMLDDLKYAKDRSFGGGAIASLEKYGQDASNVGAQVGSAFTSAFKGMEDAIVQFTMTGKASFSSFALSVVADIQKILIRQALLAPIAGGLSSWIGGLAGASASSSAGMAGNAGVGISSSVPSMAGGLALADGTNYIPYDGFPATLHKGEAVVPAQYNPANGGSGGGSVNNVTVQVNMNGSDKTTANSQDASKLGALISNVVKATIIKEQRNGGLLSGA
jgi:lambda family phage tail tape measure protein